MEFNKNWYADDLPLEISLERTPGVDKNLLNDFLRNVEKVIAYKTGDGFVELGLLLKNGLHVYYHADFEEKFRFVEPVKVVTHLCDYFDLNDIVWSEIPVDENPDLGDSLFDLSDEI